MSTTLYEYFNYILYILITYSCIKNLFISKENQLFSLTSLLLLNCIFAPIILKLIIHYFKVDILTTGAFLNHQKNFYLNIDYFIPQISFIIFIFFIIYFFLINGYRNYIKGLNKNFNYTKFILPNFLFLFSLTCILPFYFYVKLGCLDNNSVDQPYLISHLFSGKFLIFNLFFIYKLPLLMLIYVFRLNIKYKNLVIVFISIIYLILNIRTSSIFFMGILFFILIFYYSFNNRTIFLSIFLFVLLGSFLQVKSHVNSKIISTCISSVSILNEYSKTTVNEFFIEGPNSSIIGNQNKFGVVKNTDGEFNKYLSPVIRILARLDITTTSVLALEKENGINTYQNIYYKFIPRFLWKNKPIDRSTEIIMKEMNFKVDNTEITVIKANLFAESILNFKITGLILMLIFYLAVSIIVGHYYQYSKNVYLITIMTYSFSNFLIFDDLLSMLIGNLIYDLVVCTILVISYIAFSKIYKFLKK